MSKISSFDGEQIAGFLHEPRAKNRGGLALTHGSGGNCGSRLLVAVADAFCEAGWTVLRYDLPFRRKRPFGPPAPASAAMDQAGVAEAIEAVKMLAAGPLVAGGHSYGGRQTTMMAAKRSGICDGVLALSYPLHPPKKPQQLRTAHFPELKTPILFVHGSNDPFGSPEEMRTALAIIPAATELQMIDHAGHDLKGGKFDIRMLAVGPLEKLLSGTPAL